MPIPSAKFLTLDPRQFENLVYDMVKHLGVQNLTWRTPGADGGRDMEGEIASYDLSGSVQHQKWYVECKRYDAAIDWATVWKKIAFADSHQADFLLIATTSTLSPGCETEISTWNANRRKPAVRSWNVYELGHVLERMPELAVRYGLSDAPAVRDRGFLALASEASKLTQTAYSAKEFKQDTTAPLEAGAAMSELLSVRMTDVSLYGQLQVAPYQALADAYAWQQGAAIGQELDRFGLRAALSVYRLMCRTNVVVVSHDGGGIVINGQPGSNVFKSATKILQIIATWSNFEISIFENSEGHSSLRIEQREI